MNTPKFVLKPSEAGYMWCFELQASNGKVLYTSHWFTSKQNAIDGITALVNTIKSNPKIICDTGLEGD